MPLTIKTLWNALWIKSRALTPSNSEWQYIFESRDPESKKIRMKDIDSSTLLRAAIGSQRKGYYNQKFDKYVSAGLPLLSWNWAGFVFGFLWFVYRKIWFVVLPLLALLVVGEMLLPERLGFIVRISSVVLGCLLGALFGNQLYFLWAKFLIWQGLHNGKEDEELEAFVKREGGTIKDMPIASFLKE